MNLTQSGWDDSVLLSVTTRDQLACAHQCAGAAWATPPGTPCNAYRSYLVL